MGVCVVSPVTEVTRIRCDRSPRVMLLTDAASAEAIPESIQKVADDIQYGNLSWVNRFETPPNCDGAVIWCRGELPLAGSPADWRRPFFSRAHCNTSVAVIWSYLEHADLVGLEPRLLRAQPSATIWNPLLRVAGSKPSEKLRTAWRANGKPWSRLSLTLWQELERTGSGVDPLLELWKSEGRDATFSPLVLRNLIVILMKCGKWEKAGELLDLGTKAFPGCPEFPYIQAVYFVLQESSSKAVRFLEAALKCQGREFIGSGGENSYRAKYLLGKICELVGQQEKAVHYWLPCVMERPAFEPAVRALTQQHLPRGKSTWLHYPLAEMVRREPQYLECVVDFMIANKMTLASRRLVETIAIGATRRERLLDIVREADRRLLPPRPRTSEMKPGILLSGPLFDASGHSRINRAIGQALIESPEFETALDATTWPTLPTQTLKYGQTLRKSARRQLKRVDLTVRHQWPPDFTRPASGKLACILPWEHQAIPLRWIEEIEGHVDEVWTPSHFTRNALVAAGLSADRVHVVYNGVDPEVFRPDGPVNRPPNSKGFVFLFVGGTIRRKGIDLLLQAYADTFSSEEDVTLVIKDVGSRSFYSQNTKLGDVWRFAARRSAPHSIVLTEEMDDTALASLYRGANALVLPYRGEGFGMPLIEAMACGKPIITTGEGPAIEFCSEQEGYLVPAQLAEVPEPPPPVGPLSGPWTWFEPNIAVLAERMRYVFEHRDQAASRGLRGAAAIERGFTWKRILPIYLERAGRLVPVDIPISRES